MPQEDEKFFQALRLAFKEEANTHIETIFSELILLEKTAIESEKESIIETMLREAHTLKGASRVVGFVEIETACQQIETIFSQWKASEVLSIDKFDFVHAALHRMQEFLASIDYKKILPRGTLSTKINISTAKLDALLLQTEETLNIKITTAHREAELSELSNALQSWHNEWEKSLAFIPTSENILSLYNRNLMMLKNFEEKLAESLRHIHRDRYNFGILLDDLLAEAKKILILPFSTLLDVFPKMVRDLSRTNGKDVNFEIHGDEVQIDKRMLEELKYVLMHIIRNCIDHGIEKSAMRIKSNKPPQGVIKISISQTKGNEVEIIISDDGKGIDVSAVTLAAIARGIITEEKAKQLSTNEIVNLIYHSGLSTSPVLTEISGRGLGMSIIQEKIDKIGGKLCLETIPEQGTTIKIYVPLTLATFKGVLVQAASQWFVLPTANLERILRIKPDEIKPVETKETIVIDKEVVFLVCLESILELPMPKDSKLPGNPRDFTTALIIHTAGKRLAIKVDAVLHEEEIFVKNFTKPLIRLRNVAGATVFGSGKIIPILDVSDLFHSAMKYEGKKQATQAIASKQGKKTILLVEDSITTRTLLKNILELAGFDVTTAVDGANALLLLKSHTFSMVVSDVEIPFVNGIELTKQIRSNKKLENLPVVLVTSRESTEDRECGIDAGADAYLLKSSFDSAQLVNIINRLI